MSVVLVGFLEPDVVCSVDLKVRGIDIVALYYHFKHFRLVHGALLHEENDLVLYSYRVVDVVIHLDLQLILKLPILLQNLFIFYRIGEVFIVFRQQTHFTVVRPGVKLVAHRILSPDPNVLASSE